MIKEGKYTIVGCGAMGCAFGDVLSRSGSDVLMVVLPFDEKVHQHCGVEKKPHPAFGRKLHEHITWRKEQDLTREDIEHRDILMAVNSEGIDWSIDWLARWDGLASGLLYATKGLPAYSSHLEAFMEFQGGDGLPLGFGVLAGPCLAGDLAKEIPSSLLVASRHKELRDRTLHCFSQVVHIHMETSLDVVGAAWCSALKNLYAIGISAAEGLWREKADHDARNVQASLFVKSLKEMEYILLHMQLDGQTAWGLAGLGDLYVTVGGGRNGRFGRLLGEGKDLKTIEEIEMKGTTIEGLSLARALYPIFIDLVNRGRMDWNKLPLMKSLFATLVEDKPLRLC